MTSLPTRWQLVYADSQIRRHWPGEVEHVVFNAASGDLHLLNPAAIRVLDHLAAGPACLEQLCLSLETLDAAALSDVLESLDRLGLVSPLAT